MGLHHAFSFLRQVPLGALKEWIEAQVSGEIPDLFSYISSGVCEI